MSPARTISLIARRDYNERIRSRAFIVATAVLVLFTVGGIIGAIVAQHFSGGQTSHTIGVVSPPAGFDEALGVTGDAYNMRLTSISYPNEAAADAALDKGSVDAVLIGTGQIRFRDNKDTNLVNAVGQAVRSANALNELKAAGVSETQIRNIFSAGTLQVTYAKPSGSSGANQGAAIIMAIVLFGALLSYNQWILMSVVEEKATRIVEVLLAVVRPWQLLTGKLAGVLSLAITQMVIVAVVFLIAITAAGKASIPDVSASQIIVAVAWFVLGLLFYSVGFAAVGATVSRQEDASAAAAPLTMVLMAAYFLSLYFVSSSGDSLPAQIMTFIPFTAPLVVPVRFALAALPLWQELAAIAIMVASIAAVSWLGGRLYTGAILQTGPRLGLGGMVRTLLRQEPRPTS